MRLIFFEKHFGSTDGPPFRLRSARPLSSSPFPFPADFSSKICCLPVKRLPKGLTTRTVSYYCVQDTRWTISFRSPRTRTLLKSLQTCHYPCMVAPPLCFRVYSQKSSHPHQGKSVISFLSVCNVPLDNIIYFAVVGANTCFVYHLERI